MRLPEGGCNVISDGRKIILLVEPFMSNMDMAVALTLTPDAEILLPAVVLIFNSSIFITYYIRILNVNYATSIIKAGAIPLIVRILS